MIHIALATDGAYVPWVATAMRSALDHHPAEEVSFDLLHDRGADIDSLRSFVEESGGTLAFHEVPTARVADLPAVERFGRIVWARFLLPELLPSLERVLYIDADTFVVGSLGVLWNTSFDGSSLGAVANVVEPAMRPHVRSLGCTYPGGFFNSGVLLMNLDAMRRDDTWNSLRTLLAQRGADLVWPDQDALNILFAGRWKALHPRWNAMNSLWTWSPWAQEVFGETALREAKTDPAILHFEGPILNKPWHYLSPHPAADAYRATLARTPWATTPLLDRTIGTRIIALAPKKRWPAAYVNLLRLRRRVGRLRRSIARKLG